MTFIDIDPPPVEPVTLDEAKRFLRVDHDDEDTLIQTLIASARETLEARLNVAMIRRAMQASFAAGGEICLPRWPVASVDTVLADGVITPNYQADLRKRPTTVNVTSCDHVEIAFTAGYGHDPSDIPAPLRQAMLLMIARGYEDRGEDAGTVPLMVDALTMPYRVVGL